MSSQRSMLGWIAWGLGAAGLTVIATSGGGVGIAVAVGVAALVVVLGIATVRQDQPTRASSMESRLAWLAILAMLAFVLSSFTWRVRSSADLADNPLDGGAFVRFGLSGLAVGFVALGMMAEHRSQSSASNWKAGLLVTPSAFAVGYVLAVIPGTLFALYPGQVLFRAVDLLMCITVAIAAARWLPTQTLIEAIRAIFFGMAVLVVVSALVLPSQGFPAARGGIVPFRMTGVYPAFPYNSVGFIGLGLVALSIGAKRFKITGIILGVAFVLLSQYRTGYIALAAVGLVYLVATGGVWKKVLLAVSIPFGILASQIPIVQEAWTRGEEASSSVENLSGRTEWWAAAFRVLERSPIFGTGLTSGTRFEVLGAQFGNADTSTIHGAWVEVVVGTGYVGATVLGLMALTSIIAAWRNRRVSVAPLAFMAVVLVRSLSGTTIELASFTLLFFLALGTSSRGPRAATQMEGSAVDGRRRGASSRVRIRLARAGPRSLLLGRAS